MVKKIKVKYPKDIKKNNFKSYISYSNRGMSLEDDLNDTNNYYLEQDIAVVYKKPTPIQVVEGNYTKITKAYFKQPSTTDYNGIYKGRYVDFEAKETTSTTSFPLNNIHLHQIKHLENITKHKGIGFIIVRFKKLNETYLLFADDLVNYINNTDKKSIPRKYFIDKGYIIKDKLCPKVDYIEIVNKYGGLI